MVPLIAAATLIWAVAAAPEVLWALRAPFLLLSRASWWLTNPTRSMLSNPTSPWPRRLYLLGLPLLLVWGNGRGLLPTHSTPTTSVAHATPPGPGVNA